MVGPCLLSLTKFDSRQPVLIFDESQYGSVSQIELKHQVRRTATYHTYRLTFALVLFLSSFISFKSVSRKEMTILHSFLALFTISQRKGITNV